MYQKYKAEFDEELVKIRRQLENSHFKLSNLENALTKAMEFALKLPEMWQNGNLVVKRRIQKIVFPDGIRYNHQNHIYRTTRVNLLFAGIPLIQDDLLKKENGTSSNFKNLSRLVLGTGLEPVRTNVHWILSPTCLPI
ncbi:MAG TPA: hypothetical protein VKY37_12665, partial [Brumimicrobium sp.]|nr:hypothetical protein [Brumimicrobium sp.]